MVTNANLYALLEDRFAEHSASTAFILDDGSKITYGALSADVARTANALERRGVKPGDRVMAQVEKSLANVHLYLACLKAGAAFNPLNTAYTPAELEYFITDAAPTVLVVSAAQADALKAAIRKAEVAHVETMEADASGSLCTLAAVQPDRHVTAARATDDMAALLYTSGTTGRSKGAMITHGNLSSNALTLRDYWGFDRSDVLLHALPIFHVHGLFTALNTALLSGACVRWQSKFDIAAVLGQLPQATVMMGVPTHYTRLLAEPEFGRAHAADMRLFISGSAPLLSETHVDFEVRTGTRILERYGMTETGMITSNPYIGGERIAGTVGYALPGISVRIAGDDGKTLPAGQVGVLEVKGPNVFKGYWQAPDKTAKEFRADGFFITGDLAVMAPDGRISIVGRSKDLIISGGFNVYPKEIEDELNAIPGVLESAVIGVPHPDFGESVIGIITAQAGGKTPSETDILKLLGSRLAKFKLPKRIFVVAELPRNAMGKVQKAELRNTYGRTFVT